MHTNPLHVAALRLMPNLRYTPTDPSLYTSFAVAGDAYGTFHLLSHHREFSLLYVKVDIDDGHVAVEPTFKTHTDDLCFTGAGYLGELFMQPPKDALDFGWYREGVGALFRVLLHGQSGGSYALPACFRADIVNGNNGRVVIRLAQALRRASQPRPTLRVPLPRYAF